jgi:hypothetical protein
VVKERVFEAGGQKTFPVIDSAGHDAGQLAAPCRKCSPDVGTPSGMAVHQINLVVPKQAADSAHGSNIQIARELDLGHINAHVSCRRGNGRSLGADQQAAYPLRRQTAQQVKHLLGTSIQMPTCLNVSNA